MSKRIITAAVVIIIGALLICAAANTLPAMEKYRSERIIIRAE